MLLLHLNGVCFSFVCVKWRDVVSFASHPLKGWSRLVRRCLQLLIKEMTMADGSLGFSKLTGVRDLAWATNRMGAPLESLKLKEQDMSDMFWEIPSHEVQAATQWAVGACKKRRRGKQLWFSLSKESRGLDRIGKSSHRQFRILHADHMLRFVDYDLFDNTLFVLHRLILRQGGSGVPIGGFISAQLAELWALWRENRQLQGEVEDRNLFERAWNDAMHSQETVFPEVQPPERPVRPSLCGSVTGPSDFTLSPAAAHKPLTWCRGLCSIMRVSRGGGRQWRPCLPACK